MSWDELPNELKFLIFKERTRIHFLKYRVKRLEKIWRSPQRLLGPRRVDSDLFITVSGNGPRFLQGLGKKYMFQLSGLMTVLIDDAAIAE
jgi:hypothetical protein